MLARRLRVPAMLSLVVAAALAGAAALAACGSDADPGAPEADAATTDAAAVVRVDAGAPADAGLAESAFVPGLVGALCEALAPCCTAAGYPKAAATCAELLGDGGTSGNASMLGALVTFASVGLTYDPAAAQACIDGVGELASVCSGAAPAATGGLFGAPALLARCSTVYTGGTGRPGAACTLPWQCAAPAGGYATCSPVRGGDAGSSFACVTVVAAGLHEACTPNAELATASEVRSCALSRLGADAGATGLACDAATRTCVNAVGADAGAADAGGVDAGGVDAGATAAALCSAL